MERFESIARAGILIIDPKNYSGLKTFFLGSRGPGMGHWRPEKAWKPLQNKGFEQKGSSICNQKSLKLLKTISKTNLCGSEGKSNLSQNLENTEENLVF